MNTVAFHNTGFAGHADSHVLKSGTAMEPKPMGHCLTDFVQARKERSMNW